MTINLKSAAAKFLSQGRPIRHDSITFMLRSCTSDMSAYGGFVWSTRGAVECPDWNPEQTCGRGLHGLLRGEGNAALTAGDAPTAQWLVVAVWADDVVDLGGKVKAPRGWVGFTGSRPDAVSLMQRLGCSQCVWGTATAGDRGTATAGEYGTSTAGYRGTATAGYRGTATAGEYGTSTAGYRGTATAGDRGTATAGEYGTSTAGYRGTATAGEYGTSTAGYRGTATAGYRGTATAGDRGTATAGDRGTATAGERGTATAGDRGTATAGDRGTATAGEYGTATAGEGGELRIRRFDGSRYRTAVGYIGEGGLVANVKYRLDGAGKFVEA